MRKRKLFSIVLSVLTTLVLIETTTYLFFKMYGSSRLEYHLKVDDHIFKKNLINYPPAQVVNRNFDALLGWDEALVKTGLPGPHAFASRTLSKQHSTTLISTYGDSFTFGQSVNDDETWQHYMGDKLNTNVINYGARGTGVDQALIKLEKNINQGKKTKIIVLGMLSETIARIVNISQQHYWATTDSRSFKPLFQIVGEKIEWHFDPLKKLDTNNGRKELMLFIEQHDFWFKYNKLRPVITFPYTFSFIKSVNYFMHDVKRWNDLYADKYATKLFNKIVERFYSLSTKENFIPILLIIPEPRDLKNLLQGDKPFYSEFLLNLRNKYSNKDLLIIDASKGDFDYTRFNRFPFQGHTSAYGNKQISESIYNGLVEAKLTMQTVQ